MKNFDLKALGKITKKALKKASSLGKNENKTDPLLIFFAVIGFLFCSTFSVLLIFMKVYGKKQESYVSVDKI